MHSLTQDHRHSGRFFFCLRLWLTLHSSLSSSRLVRCFSQQVCKKSSPDRCTRKRGEKKEEQSASFFSRKRDGQKRVRGKEREREREREGKCKKMMSERQPHIGEEGEKREAGLPLASIVTSLVCRLVLALAYPGASACCYHPSAHASLILLFFLLSLSLFLSFFFSLRSHSPFSHQQKQDQRQHQQLHDMNDGIEEKRKKRGEKKRADNKKKKKSEWEEDEEEARNKQQATWTLAMNKCCCCCCLCFCWSPSKTAKTLQLKKKTRCTHW